jgi:ATP/maltotriose-dependent transcriptional regulator MalT
VHYRRAGWPPAYAIADIAAAAFFGPQPVVEAIRRCEQLLSDAGGSRAIEGHVRAWLGGLEAMRGNFDAARSSVARGLVILDELGQAAAAAVIHAVTAGTVEMLAAEYGEAERILRTTCDFCERSRDWAHLSTLAAELADAIYAQGRYDEAADWARIAEKHATTTDVSAEFSWRSVLAKAIAQEGALAEAERLAREAADIVGRTDSLNQHAKVLADLAEVIRLAGRLDEAESVVGEAVALYERKGNAVAAQKTRALRRDPTPA